MTLTDRTTHLTEGPEGPVTDLTQFLAAPPPPRARGVKAIWPARFSQMLDQVPGQWIDATAAWGVKKTASSSIRTHARKLELDVEVRVGGDHVYVKIR